MIGMHARYKLPGWTTKNSIEFCTRSIVRDKYEEIFGVSAAEPRIKALWEVLDRIYPCSADQLSHHG